MLHIIAWSAIIFFPFIFPLIGGPNTASISNIMFFRNLFRIGLMIVFFYANSEWLIPKYLFKRKYTSYWGYVFVFVLTIFLVNGLFTRFIDHPLVLHRKALTTSLSEFDAPFRLSMPLDSIKPAFNSSQFHLRSDGISSRVLVIRGAVIPTFFSVLLVFALSTSLKITSEWLKNESKRKEMETEKLQSELSFLKSQVNPHFLFNTLNNIYYLAYKKSDDTTTALFKLSQLMRYMLYESDVSKINLQKEIEYLENYIDLQKIRATDNLVINFVKEGNIEAYNIEPMLLIPFVENAFKHGITNLEDCKIDILVSVLNDKLLLKVSNKIYASKNIFTTDKGIGLQNVRQRLNLLYPGKHQLELNHLDNYYYVILKLVLNK